MSRLQESLKSSGQLSTKISCVSLCDLLFKNEERVLCILQEYTAYRGLSVTVAVMAEEATPERVC